MPTLGVALDAAKFLGPMRELNAEMNKFRNDVRSVTLTGAQYNRMLADLGKVQTIMTQQGFTQGAAAIATFRKGIEDTVKTTDNGMKVVVASMEKLKAASEVLKATKAAGPKMVEGKDGIKRMAEGEGVAGVLRQGGLQEALAGMDAALIGTQKFTTTWEKLINGFSNGTPAINASRRALMELITTIGLGLSVRSLVQSYAQFELTLANIRAATGATTAEMGLLENAARKMGTTTQFSANQAADGLLVLVRAGFTAREAIASLKPVMDLATAAQIDVGQATLYVSSVMKQYQMNVDRVSDVTDILMTIANRTTTDVKELAEAFKFVGPVAAAAGISIEDTAAALGVLAESGIRGSLAGTSLRALLDHLSSPTSRATRAIRDLNLGLDALDPSANKLVEVLEQLAYANVSVGAAADIAGRRSSSNVIVLGRNVDAYKNLRQAIDEGTGVTAKASELVGDTLTGSFNKLKAAVTEVSIAWGRTGLAGILQGTVDAGSRVLQMFAGVETASASATFATTALNAGVKGLTISMIAFIGVGFLGHIAKMIAAYRALDAAQKTLFAFMSTNPFGLATIAVSALVGGLWLLYDVITAADAKTIKYAESLKLLKERQDQLAAASRSARDAVASITFATDRDDVKDVGSGLATLVSDLKSAAVALRQLQQEQGPGVGADLTDNLREEIRARQRLIELAGEQARQETERLNPSQAGQGFAIVARQRAMEEARERIARFGPVDFPSDTRGRVDFGYVEDLVKKYPDLIDKVQRARSAYEGYTESEKKAQASGLLYADALELITQALDRSSAELRKNEELQKSPRVTADEDKLRALAKDYDEITAKIREETEAIGQSERQMEFITRTREMLKAAQKAGIEMTKEEIAGIQQMARDQQATASGPMGAMLVKMYEQIAALNQIRTSHDKMVEARKKSESAAENLSDVTKKYEDEVRLIGLEDEARERITAQIAIEKQVKELLGDATRREAEARRLGVSQLEVENALVQEYLTKVDAMLARIHAVRIAHEKRTEAQKKAQQAEEEAQRKRENAGSRALDTEQGVQRQIQLLEQTVVIAEKYGLAFRSAREDAAKIVEFEQMLAAAQGVTLANLSAQNQERVRGYAESLKELRAREAAYREQERRKDADEWAMATQEDVTRKAQVIPYTAEIASKYGLSYRSAREDAGAIVEFERKIAEAQGVTVDKLDATSRARVQQYADSLEYLRLLERIERTAQDMGNSFGEAFGSFITGAKDAKGAAMDLFKSIQAMMVQELVARPIASMFASWFSGFGMSLFGGGMGGGGKGGGGASMFGNAFHAGITVPMTGIAATPFMFGGMPELISGPTYFPMAGGRTGVAGEFADEIILPAKRTSRGELGVAVAGGAGGGMTVNQNFEITSGDGEGVKRSMPQIMRKASAGIRDARRGG